ncbi:Uncaracterized surface protein containing fasciclin (FAS1) repeats [Flavobacterium succinicans]|uniref:Uncaracterized surface protein containing fasciclin (FAS1) repeats n=1 Tax=Flavobacterium succinicans TaxID=29536 RepID=A0A1I4TCA1_9FLAO|nr:fasciclin domain-containing protein [Flavobacterium succinicans]SFM74408.1 Uncaracterized surface protein containing fasciclin (FAS1) repeats [Flavobacterium succinicans]
MKIASKLKMALACIAFLSFAVSCDDDDNNDPKPVDNTITGIAVNNSNLKILVQALTRAELAATLQGAGPFTVFAPTDAAFTKFLTDNKFASVADVPKDVLTQILLNHVVSGTVKSTALTTGYVKTLAKSTASGSNTMSMYVDLTSGVKLNGGAKVTTADVMASNGVIHIVDAVINLPTIVTHATANPNFTTLVATLTFNPASGFAATLSGTASSPFTVFAPTNDAFASFLTETKFSGLAAIPPTLLETVLKYHVVTGANVLSTQLTNDQVINTFAGQNVTVKFTPTRLQDASARNCNIIAVDVQCSNGVIHVLDKVLLPK